MIEHWNCEHCKLYNDILNNHCKACHADKPTHITTEYQVSIEFKRGIFYGYGVLSMTPEEQKFKEFFADEVMLVKDMDIPQLRERRAQLAAVMLEGKARVIAVDDNIKEKSSKTKNKQFLVSIESVQSESDAINTPKIRAARMSKIDKMREQYLRSGIDEETVNIMIANLERKGTEDSVKPIASKEFEVKVNPFAAKVEVKPLPNEQTQTQTEADIKPPNPNPFAVFAKKG